MQSFSGTAGIFMRRMKDSGIEWIGEIPEEWETRRAKNIFAQRISKGNNNEILLAATQKQGVIPQSELEGVVQVKEDTDLQQFRTVHKKDFVISLRSFQGGFEYSKFEGVCSPAYQVFYGIVPIFHHYYRMLFKSDGFIQKVNSLTVGIREGKNIQYSDFANSIIPVPPIDEQECIADYLDRKCAEIDAVIARQEAVIEKLKEYKLSLITEAVTKGLNPDAPMKDSGVEWIGQIPKHWSVVKIKYVAFLYNGDRSSNYPSGTDIVDEGVLFITSNNLNQLVLDTNIDSNKFITEEKYQILRGAKVHINDIIYCLRGSVGKCCINKSINEGTIASSLVDIRPVNINPDYLNFVLQCPELTETAVLNAIGIGSLNLAAKDISELYIPFPDLQEMANIVRYLIQRCECLDKALSNKQSLIDKLTAYKKSMIYEVVTGKREVPA